LKRSPKPSISRLAREPAPRQPHRRRGHPRPARELGVDELVESSHATFLLDALITDRVADDDEGALLDAVSIALERLAMQSQGDELPRRKLFDAAFVCRRAAPLAAMDRRGSILHHFSLCVDGLIGERWAELGMLLRERDRDEYPRCPTNSAGTTSSCCGSAAPSCCCAARLAAGTMCAPPPLRCTACANCNAGASSSPTASSATAPRLPG